MRRINQFHIIAKPSQALCAGIIGRTELTLCESLSVSRGYGDEDDCYSLDVNAGGFAGLPTDCDAYAMREPFQSETLDSLYWESVTVDEAQ